MLVLDTGLAKLFISWHFWNVSGFLFSLNANASLKLAEAQDDDKVYVLKLTDYLWDIFEG